MRRIGLVLFLTFVAMTAVPATALAADFTVTNQAMTAWLINGQANPPLTLTTGHTYTFQVTATGHPFWIKTAQTLGSANAFNTGVTNNGLENGTLTFTVPAGAPSTLFYQCGVHVPMTNSITITSPPPVPAMGPLGAAVLALTLFAGGLVAYRKRAAA
jgi:hypothetical protein